MDFGGQFSARYSKQNSAHWEENFEENDLFRSFCSLKNLSGHWAKTLRTLRENFRTGCSKVHFCVSGRPSWGKPTCSEIFFYIDKFRHWAKHFSFFDKSFHAWLSKLHFLWPSIVFRIFFLTTNFCSIFIGFRRNISKLLVKNFHKNCQNRNLRVSGEISDEKKYVDCDNLIFSQVFSFFGWNFAGLLDGKTLQGCENYNLNNRRIVLSKSVFLRKLKLSKFFGNFSEIRRKIFRSLGEVFRRRWSKLHFTGQEKLFEGFYFEIKEISDLSTDIGRSIFGMCAKFFGMAVKIAS